MKQNYLKPMERGEKLYKKSKNLENLKTLKDTKILSEKLIKSCTIYLLKKNKY